MTQPPYTYKGQRPRVTMEDLSLAHQIVLYIVGNDIGVGCTCLGRRSNRHGMLAVRATFPAAEAMAVWRAHAKKEAKT